MNILLDMLYDMLSDYKTNVVKISFYIKKFIFHEF